MSWYRCSNMWFLRLLKGISNCSRFRKIQSRLYEMVKKLRQIDVVPITNQNISFVFEVCCSLE
jgi:hypothetical protein